MIINFKIFESDNNKKFWILPNDKLFNVRLYKIGMSIDEIKTFMTDWIKNKKNIYIGFDGKTWSYTGCEDIPKISNSNVYNKENYEYMGNIDVTNKDIENYEIIINSKKYNL